MVAGAGDPAGRVRERPRGGRLRRTWPLLGPAFVTAVAYVDPGNFATNLTAGSVHGYLLVWVVVAANAMAMLVQYLSAKSGIATGESLAGLCRRHFRGRTRAGLWLQAEAVAIATDLAEVVGGALALQLLFGLPLVVGGCVTGAVAFALLLVGGGRQRAYERVITGLLAVVLLGFVVDVALGGVQPLALAQGVVPRFDGEGSVVLAAGMLGATVMPHAIYLHSGLTSTRYAGSAVGRRALLCSQRVDVVLAMTIAGLMNLAILVIGAAALAGTGTDTIEAAHELIGVRLGDVAALLFALSLLASGFAASSVGTLSGQVVMDGFLRRRVPLTVRRLVTLAPALACLAVGVDPTRALVLSQVVLSFGIPFALVPLVWFTARRDVMGDLVNRPATTAAAAACAGVVVVLNLVLVVQLL